MKITRLIRKIATFDIPQRGAYKRLTDQDIRHFETILPKHCVLTENLEFYNEDWLKMHKGNSSCVLKPRNTGEIQAIIGYCNNEKIAIVPQGGNTGQVIGSTPIFDEVVLSMQNMNHIMKIDENQGVVWTEAGVILEKLNEFCLEKGWMVPYEIGSKGSCFVGGNVATNAGGLRYLRYGGLHGNVLGLEVVLPNGTVLSDLKGLRKDNTGYDYKQLFIGSEGTLGIITKIAMMLVPKPLSKQVAMVTCNSYDHVVRLLRLTKQNLGEVLSAFEMIDRNMFSLVIKNVPRTRSPFANESPFYVLIETSGSNKEHDMEKLQALLETALQQNIVSDAVLAQDASQAESLWRIRESGALASKAEGYVFKYDIVAPIPKIQELVLKTRERIGELGITIGYGHLADGNVHIVVVTKEVERVYRLLEPWLYEELMHINGSFTGEHGVGFLKAPMLKYARSEESIVNMVRNI